jgi:hypothetical protein
MERCCARKVIFSLRRHPPPRRTQRRLVNTLSSKASDGRQKLGQKGVQINPPLQWITLWMKACRGARNVRGILDFCDLPKNEAGDTPLKMLDFAPEWLIGVN